MALPPILRLFGQSPFKPLHLHVQRVQETVDLLKPIVKAFCEEDFDKLKELAEKTSKAEHDADVIKRDIREHLPKSIFMPVDRSDLLLFLKEQDSIADSAEDVAVLMTLRETRKIPEEIKEGLMELTDSVVATVDALEVVSLEVNKLLESYFSKKETKKIIGLIHKVDEMEWRSDKIGLNLAKTIYKHEKDLGLGVLYLNHISETLGSVADHAENTGDRLRTMIASR